MFCSKSCRISVTVSKHQHSLQSDLKSNIYSLQCYITNLHPHKLSCLLEHLFVLLARVLTSQFYPAALTHESSSFSLFRDKAYWASSSHSFFLLHASSGCPPLSTCADSHRTPARKRRLTTRETLAHTPHVCLSPVGVMDPCGDFFSWALLCDLCAV